MPVDASQGLNTTGSGGESTMGAMADSLSGLANITKGISGVIEGIFQIITKLFNAIMDASPLLQGMLKIIDKMFKLILMPIGNMIGRLLMPYVIRMAKRTSEFLSKYGNAGPEQMGDILTQGLTIAIESMVDMLMVVLTKVLWPVITALGQAIVNGLAYILSGGTAGKLGMEDYNQTITDMVGQDLESLMGDAAIGMAGVIDQFGFTVQTGNRIMGNSFSESATVFYKGSADIANGFQSVHEVLVVGTTKAIEKVNEMFNLHAAGFVTIIDTVKTPFIELVPLLDNLIETLEEVPEKEEETGGGGGTGGWKWWQWLAAGAGGPIAGLLDIAGVEPVGGYKEQGHEWLGGAANPNVKGGAYANYLGMANGGIITRPTRILAGEAGPEAFIPLDKAGGMGQTINVHFHGDVYGMDDFDRKVEKSVSKYSGRVRGAY